MTQSARPDDGRAALEGFVTNRLGRSAPRPAPARPQPKTGDAAAQDFETLPGYRELKLQRSAADLSALATRSFAYTTPRPAPRRGSTGRRSRIFSSYDYLGLNGHPR